jgi:hypothetical protein
LAATSTQFATQSGEKCDVESELLVVGTLVGSDNVVETIVVVLIVFVDGVVRITEVALELSEVSPLVVTEVVKVDAVLEVVVVAINVVKTGFDDSDASVCDDTLLVKEQPVDDDNVDFSPEVVVVIIEVVFCMFVELVANKLVVVGEDVLESDCKLKVVVEGEALVINEVELGELFLHLLSLWV